MNYIRKPHLTVDLAGPDKVLLCLYRYDLANIVNRALQKYMDGGRPYKFQKGEEFMTQLSVAQLAQLAPSLNIVGLVKPILRKSENGTMASTWAAFMAAP